MAELFPRATSDRDIVARSDATEEYNCIAWAVWHQGQVIWPDARSQWGWPQALARNETIQNFEAFFALMGYAQCADGDPEAGHEKIVIYAENGRVTHTARLQDDGKWTSKFGGGIDAEHSTPEKLVSQTYGVPVRYMRRVSAGKPKLPDDMQPKPHRIIGAFGQGLIR
jgi:hypothetical protein